MLATDALRCFFADATHAFLANLAAFPPVPGGDFTPAVGGESLDEYAVGAEEDVGEAVEEEVPAGASKRLEEIEEVTEGSGEDGLVAEPAEELLYDPDDDIVDSDD